MKPSASQIGRRLAKIVAKVEATLVPPPREWLQVIIDDGDDEAEAKERRLPSTWLAILKMSAARLGTSTGY